MKKVVATFEQLIQRYYGGSPDIELRPLSSLDSVITNYYGKSPRKQKGKCKPSAQVTTRADDGEVLSHHKNGKCDEYVVQSSVSAPADTGNEYVVERCGCCTAAPAKVTKNSTDQDVAAAAECKVDLLQSQQQSVPNQTRQRPSAPSIASSTPLPARQPSSEVMPLEKAEARSSEDDFAADLKAILTGQSVYDSQKRKMVSRDQMDREKSQSSNGNGDRPAEQTNQHEIFDRIAKSMQYANQFDLGEVALSKRLDDFDEVYELKQKAKAPARSRTMSSPAAPRAGSKPSTGDFIHDLDSIRKQCAVERPAMSLSVADEKVYDRPMFDTGEHVLIAADMYEDVLRVGKDPGVPFSYGQIVAMADLYESPDQMMSADPAELQQIKTLIKRSTDFYKGKKRDLSLDVSDDEWDQATGGRFIDLAEDNYEHFSPNFFFPNAAFAGSLNQHGNNKSAWESYHQRAIEEAQRAYLNAVPNTSVFPEYALIINAFGDHYLTDAFAAGHVINKEEMIALFKSNFFDGSSLNSAAKQFFAELAIRTFRDDLKDKFSQLETVDTPLCAFGWCLRWHPNIDSSIMFNKLLVAAAEQQPDGVANFAVKALHDKLNEEGVTVTNAAGDKPWIITGDGYLNADNLAVIRKAVLASANQIENDPSIRATGLNYGLYFADVWKYVPQLTESSRQRVITLANNYLTPTSNDLVKAAAAILTKKQDTFIKKLIREHKLQPA